ncbi:hypothetical protein BpHYR1_054304 [Brachionus plicatilis]|uniref:Uncharacterized protein n=1 Tax=Brachionus plicatilis TaxID=10195 RepID=A0A3M7QUN1_BRAPC|nr:hypothetical protein BpHYR1_054304 [Brachionus plicatilis]
MKGTLKYLECAIYFYSYSNQTNKSQIVFVLTKKQKNLNWLLKRPVYHGNKLTANQFFSEDDKAAVKNQL